MQHPYDQRPRVRMPRACKRTSQNPEPSVRPTRRTRADLQREILQHQQSTLYTAAAPVRHEYPIYNISDQRNIHANNGLHPNLQLPRATAPYTPAAINQQHLRPRYNTRRAVHGLPSNNTPNAERFWHPRMSTPTPQPHMASLRCSVPLPGPVQTKDVMTQTEMLITENEFQLLKKIQQQNVDVSKLYSIIERSDYIVTFDDSDNESNEGNSETETVDNNNEIASCNIVQQTNDMVTLAYVANLQQRLAALLPSANALPAIEYNPMPQNDSNNTSAANAMQNTFMPSTFSNNDQNEIEDDLRIAEELITEDANNNNIQLLPMQAQQQVAANTTEVVTNNYRNNNESRRDPQNLQHYRVPNFCSHPSINNVNILQAAALLGHYYNPHVWPPAPNMFMQRPPWQ